MLTDYFTVLSDVYHNGHLSGDRTGKGTRKLFGRSMRFDLSDNQFPLLEEKTTPLRLIWAELKMFIQGGTNNEVLAGEDVNIWNEWAYDPEHPSPNVLRDAFDTVVNPIAKGELGPIYGAQWRNWSDLSDKDADEVNYSRDQLKDMLVKLRDMPDSRRNLVSGWNVAVLPDETKSHTENVENGKQVLPPCHTMFQVLTREDDEGKRYLTLIMYQRSADMFLGVPFNIASYALLAKLLCVMAGYEPEALVIHMGDSHVYSDHENTELLLQRRHDREDVQTTRLYIDNLAFGDGWDQAVEAELRLEDYRPKGRLTGVVSV